MTIVDDHIKRLKGMKDQVIEAGWFESARYQAGKDISPEMVGMSVARVARINEFGATIKTKKAKIIIPERPFMRLAYQRIRTKRQNVQKKIAKQIIEGKITPEQSFKQIGLFMEGEIVDSIKNGGWVANAPSTEKRKGFNKPLIHTGQMWQAVASKVSTAQES
jgi:hypothetical protein